MARQRFIWPDLWTDPQIGRLGSDEMVFFIGCFSNADDDGRLLADAAYLRSIIFPYRDFSIERVTQIRDNTIAACDNLYYYTKESGEYLCFLKWGDYQKPKYPRPSKLPPPPAKVARLSQKSSGKTSGSFRERSPKPSEALGEASGTGLGSGLGREKLKTPPPKPELPETPKESYDPAADELEPQPDDGDDYESYMWQRAMSNGAGWSRDYKQPERLQPDSVLPAKQAEGDGI